MKKTSILGYGQSDSGKSTQARYIAEYVYRITKKKTRLIALDRGSLWAPCQDLVDEKVVIPCEFPTGPEFNPYAIMRKLRRGMWPENGVINQPTPGIMKGTQFVPLKPGDEVPLGVEIRYKTNTKWHPWSDKESEEIGAIVVDSLTTFATAYMSDAKQKNIRIGAESNSTPRNEEGEQTGSNTIAHYGDAHTEILDAVQAFQALPPMITYFTALEGLGSDDDTGVKRPALGPDTVGKAINGKLPARFNHTFHMVAEGVGSAKKVKAWYCKHDSDIKGLQWPAKVTLTPVELKAFWKKYPLGYIPLTLEQGLGEFLDFRDSIEPAFKLEKVS